MVPSWRRSRARGDEARPAAVLLLLPQPVLLGRGAQDRGAVPPSPALARVPALLGAGAGDAGRADGARRGAPLPADEPGAPALHPAGRQTDLVQARLSRGLAGRRGEPVLGAAAHGVSPRAPVRTRPGVLLGGVAGALGGGSRRGG